MTWRRSCRATSCGIPRPASVLYQGLLDVMAGNRSGVDGVRASVAGWLSDKGISHLSYNLCMLARSGLLTGNLEVSRAAVAQAKLRSAEHGEDFMEPELWRLDGEIAARDGDIEHASASFVSGVEVARRQGAVWLELKLAESIERLGDDPASRERPRCRPGAYRPFRRCPLRGSGGRSARLKDQRRSRNGHGTRHAALFRFH